MSERKLESVAELVWYDNQHTSGTVYRSQSGLMDDGQVHIVSPVIFYKTIIHGTANFEGRVTIGDGFRQASENLVISTPVTVDPDKSAFFVENLGGMNNLVTINGPATTLKAVSGVSVLVKNVGTNPVGIVPEGLTQVKGVPHYSISMHPDTVVWMMWIKDGYRVIHMTAEY